MDYYDRILHFYFNSCSKQDASPSNTGLSSTEVLSYDIKGNNAHVTISLDSQIINVQFPSNDSIPGNLIADFTLSPGAQASVNNIVQTSGVTTNNFNAGFYFNVKAANGNSVLWTVKPENNSYTYNWGLGYFLYNHKSADRPYNWYIDQMNTGFDSSDNCGPSDVTMVCKWADSSFTKTAGDARKTYVPNGGWWSTGDIDSYLSDNNVNHGIINLGADIKSLTQTIKRQINLGQIAIVNLDMNLVRAETQPQLHVDRFYSTTPSFGHFLVIKGYSIVDGNTFFETYDSNSWGASYLDGSPQGKDRYYRAEDILNSCHIWWPYMFIIAKKGSALVNRLPNEHATDNFISIKHIPVNYGR